MSSQFGAKPAALRCARCGKFVDWEEAQLQIACSCRPHFDLPPVLVREATDDDRVSARSLFERDFGRTKVVAFGESLDLDEMPLLVAELSEGLSGALAYRQHGEALHVVALATDPMWQRSGVGGYLIAEAEMLARRLGLHSVIVATTNDNLPALYFYQRRGYRITDLAPASMLAHTQSERRGFAGIPVRDGIRLEKKLTR